MSTREDREFVQKTIGTTLKHRFLSDRLVYTHKDLSGAVEFSIRYETIVAAHPYVMLIKDAALRRTMQRLSLTFVVLAALLFYVPHPVGRLAALSCLGIAVALTASAVIGVGAAKYTMLKMEPLPPGAGKLVLRVKQDDLHDDILGEIKARWRARLRDLHMQVNPANQPDKEQMKFKWLRENDVLSDDEYRQALAELSAHEPKALRPAPAMN